MSRTLINQSAYDELESKEGKYSSERIESYFTLFELLLAPKPNPLLAVEDLHFAKQGSITSGEFHSHICVMCDKDSLLSLRTYVTGFPLTRRIASEMPGQVYSG